MKQFVQWSISLLVITGIVGGIVYSFLPQAVEVRTTAVITGPMEVTVDEEGHTRIRERYVVSSPLMGRVQRITLDPGDQVVADETVLATIEPTDPELLDARTLAEAEARVRAAEAAVRRAGANLERAKVAHEFAVDELERLIDASERSAATIRELQTAKTAERTTAEELRAAEFAREITQYELEVAQSALLYAQGSATEQRAQMWLRSPIDGVVLRVIQESVAVVTPGTPLLEVGDPRDLEVVVDVLSTDAVQVVPGDRVVIDHWGGDQSLEAVVRLVEPSAFTKISALGIEEQRVNVIADFVSPVAQRPTLADGFRIEARIIVWEDPAVRQVPTSSTFRDETGWAVFVVKEGRAHRQAIEIGRQNTNTTQIISGLVENDRVVLHPSDQLSDGVSVAESPRR